MARKKDLDFVKQEGVYMFVYRHAGDVIEYPINSTKVYINGKEKELQKPFENITKFQHFCVEGKF